MSDIEKLSYEEAVKLLPDGETIHTFMNPNGMLIGADWDRADVLKAIKKHGAEKTGESAQALGHGLAFKENGKYIFVETKGTK